jgi:hypothetical protein
MNVNGQIAKLTAARTAAGAKLDAFCRRRRELALAAAEGDRNAQKTIAQIDADAAALLAQQATLTQAIEHAEEIDRTRLAERERADRERHRAAASQIASATMKVSAEIDAALSALTKLFERRAALISQLSRTGCLPTHLSHRLATRTTGSAAAKACALDRFINIEHVSPAHTRTLSEATGVLRGALTLPEHEQAPPPSSLSPTRFRLFGGQR